MGKNIKSRQWLEKIGLGQYAEAFENNDIDAEMLLELTDDDLQQLGVVSLGHRKRILKAVASLNIRYMVDISATYDRYGDLEKERNPGVGRAWYEKSLEIRERLVGLQPENSLFLQNLTVIYGKICGIDDHNGNLSRVRVCGS